MKPRRVGFVIGNQLREIRILSADRPGGGSLGLMRFQWIADWVNAQPGLGLRYELFRPWRRYDALVFLKAMGGANQRLNDWFRKAGRPTVFDANVNYYHPEGTFYYDTMRPSEEQTREAIAMTRAASAVIADSEYVGEQARAYHADVRWIPDNVNFVFVPPLVPRPLPRGPLPLWWSGQSLKLFDLLSISDVLREYARHIELRLVTNDLAALSRWFPPHREHFERLLRDVPHRIMAFESIPALLAHYAEGGLAISPRFLDNTYNLGHTEWKITLPMACGLPAWAAPVPSYERVAERSGGRGIAICRTHDAWRAALDAVLAEGYDYAAESHAACTVVRQHYATPVVAAQHAALLRGLVQAGGAS
ncbi:MAG TPA: hypothetical protein PKE12_14550 [Kiritimatiellia bacterium]|nr:hypothetical protein [Kiritimatiellia bacterium]